ncbi:unnamed protein product [Paramecium octaurelia]|uniref:Uncharacterized protein n=1 Tax=Paramecium octaurelia TaxID=43137 RepID=A0A8S1X259_PAROT|nr:unnamed protein product [Paramecium octaurelia]
MVLNKAVISFSNYLQQTVVQSIADEQKLLISRSSLALSKSESLMICFFSESLFNVIWSYAELN